MKINVNKFVNNISIYLLSIVMILFGVFPLLLTISDSAFYLLLYVIILPIEVILVILLNDIISGIND